MALREPGAKQAYLRVIDEIIAETIRLEREQGMPTGLENGVAVPHGRSDAVDRLVCAVERGNRRCGEGERE
jgi:mannitol/fructose-specific phosphotransferase system IIA component (Ntr-type)